MPTCVFCKRKWSWWQTFKKMWTLSSTVSCPHCEKEQYQSKRSKTRAPFTSLIVLLPPFILQVLFNISGLIVLVLMGVCAVVAFAIFPFLIEFSDQEEFPF